MTLYRLGLLAVGGVVILVLVFKVGSHQLQRALVSFKVAHTQTAPNHPTPVAKPKEAIVQNDIAVVRIVPAKEDTPLAPVDPKKVPTLVAEFRDRGQESPLAAFETFIWASLRGDAARVGSLLSISNPGRQQILEMWNQLYPEARTEFPTPESLIGMAYSNQIVMKAESLQTVQYAGNNYIEASIEVRRVRVAGGGNNSTIIQMVRGQPGWQVAIPEHAITNLPGYINSIRIGGE